MPADDSLYRSLQQHLDKQAIGFPKTWSGADIRLLKRLFTPEEAKLALQLTYKPASTEQIMKSADPEFPAEQVGTLLDSMLQKGAIGWKRKEGIDHWYVLPLVIGMYECQDGNPSPEFLDDARAYMKSKRFWMSFLSVKPSQMRTIPVSQSITLEHPVTTYDQARAIVRDSSGPFVVLSCICRKSKAMRGKPCTKVAREETCLAFGDMAAMVLRRKHGRAVSRDEVFAILEQNQADGLVLQPANAQKPEFICSCCGCCCGMLSYQKMLPRPVDFWSSSFLAEADPAACVRCGTCVTRCQVEAVTMADDGRGAAVNHDRCIGCGLCVTTCPSQAMRLMKKEAASEPPLDEESLCSAIKANKKGTVGQARTVIRAALKMRP